jgi:hypothetical protein
VRESQLLNEGSERWTAVTKVQSPGEGEALRASLRNAGIASRLAPDASFAKQLELQVAEADVDEADRIINGLLGIDDPGDVEQRDDAPPQSPLVCPNCDSTDIRREYRFRLFVLFSLLAIGVCVAVGQADVAVLVVGVIAVAVLLIPPWHCRECGQRWRGYNPQP